MVKFRGRPGVNILVLTLSGLVFVACVVSGLYFWWPTRYDPASRGSIGVALMTGAILAFAIFLLQILMNATEQGRIRDREREGLRLQLAIEDNLGGIDLRGQDLSGFYLAGKQLTEAKLQNADLTDANLSAADLQRAHLDKATLHDVDLSAVNLTGGFLTGAHFAGESTLEAACLRLADIRDVDLSGVDLTGTDFSDAKYDTDTELPAGFRPKPQKPCDDPAPDKCRLPEQRPAAVSCGAG
jgi:uncharacterized protein YjbI with pentapeptide repeats